MNAKHQKGSSHFMLQRLTALALIPLLIWFCVNITLLPGANYETVISWLRSPLNAILMALLVIISFQHAHLGMQVIFEDYISNIKTRNNAITITKFLSYFMMVAGIYSIIKITLGGQ